MDDPNCVEEQQRRKLGISRCLGTTRTAFSHPSVGGTHGYDVAMQENQIWSHNNGHPTRAS